jgi:hypothetical protein
LGLTRKAIWESLPDAVRQGERRFREAVEAGSESTGGRRIDRTGTAGRCTGSGDGLRIGFTVTSLRDWGCRHQTDYPDFDGGSPEPGGFRQSANLPFRLNDHAQQRPPQ